MLDDMQSAPPSILGEVLAGLSKPQKTLPAKLFYDAEGCRLFGEITRLPEYYVTRTEHVVLEKALSRLPHRPDSALVEYGGSDEAKAVTLFERVGATTYVPIDIASEALHDIAERLHVSKPEIKVWPIATDFLQAFCLPDAVRGQPIFGFFPGSTIGNLDPDAAAEFLRQARTTLGPDARFLIGVDLRKDPSILVPAYDDAQGVTAAFNRNALTHINRAIGATFIPEDFAHRALWNDKLGRIEMHLVSRAPQTVLMAGHTITFTEGETIHTESSYKHTVAGFAALATSAGWTPEAAWTDDHQMFSLHLLAAGTN